MVVAKVVTWARQETVVVLRIKFILLSLGDLQVVTKCIKI